VGRAGWLELTENAGTPPVWENSTMNNLIRGGIAGLGCWKLGGGIITTILIFILFFWLLGHL
jgi:hypothetical protein